MNSTAIDRIAAAMNALRPDWPVSSVRTIITTRLSERAAVDVAVAMTVVACDPTSKTPARVLEDGIWWKVAQTATTSSEADRHPSNEDVRTLCVECYKPQRRHPWIGCPGYVAKPQPAEEISDILAAARAAVKPTWQPTEPKEVTA